jgi:hypothetical protein
MAGWHAGRLINRKSSYRIVNERNPLRRLRYGRAGALPQRKGHPWLIGHLQAVAVRGR